MPAQWCTLPLRNRPVTGFSLILHILILAALMIAVDLNICPFFVVLLPNAGHGLLSLEVFFLDHTQ